VTDVTLQARRHRKKVTDVTLQARRHRKRELNIGAAELAPTTGVGQWAAVAMDRQMRNRREPGFAAVPQDGHKPVSRPLEPAHHSRARCRFLAGLSPASSIGASDVLESVQMLHKRLNQLLLLGILLGLDHTPSGTRLILLVQRLLQSFQHGLILLWVWVRVRKARLRRTSCTLGSKKGGRS
jgi:hypothetical protein